MARSKLSTQLLAQHCFECQVKGERRGVATGRSRPANRAGNICLRPQRARTASRHGGCRRDECRQPGPCWKPRVNNSRISQRTAGRVRIFVWTGRLWFAAILLRIAKSSVEQEFSIYHGKQRAQRALLHQRRHNSDGSGPCAELPPVSLDSYLSEGDRGDEGDETRNRRQ